MSLVCKHNFASILLAGKKWNETKLCSCVVLILILSLLHIIIPDTTTKEWCSRTESNEDLIIFSSEFSESIYFCIRSSFTRRERHTVMEATSECLLGTGQLNQYGLNVSTFDDWMMTEAEIGKYHWHWRMKCAHEHHLEDGKLRN